MTFLNDLHYFDLINIPPGVEVLMAPFWHSTRPRTHSVSLALVKICRESYSKVKFLDANGGLF